MKFKPGDKIKIKTVAEMNAINMQKRVFGGLTYDMKCHEGKIYTIRELDRDCLKYGEESYYFFETGFTWDVRLLDRVYESILNEDLFEL